MNSELAFLDYSCNNLKFHSHKIKHNKIPGIFKFTILKLTGQNKVSLLESVVFLLIDFKFLILAFSWLDLTCIAVHLTL